MTPTEELWKLEVVKTEICRPYTMYAPTALDAMKKYVQIITESMPEPEKGWNFYVKATLHENLEIGYPFYKEHVSRIPDMHTMKRMAIHVNPEILHR